MSSLGTRSLSFSDTSKGSGRGSLEKLGSSSNSDQHLSVDPTHPVIRRSLVGNDHVVTGSTPDFKKPSRLSSRLSVPHFQPGTTSTQDTETDQQFVPNARELRRDSSARAESEHNGEMKKKKVDLGKGDKSGDRFEYIKSGERKPVLHVPADVYSSDDVKRPHSAPLFSTSAESLMHTSDKSAKTSSSSLPVSVSLFSSPESKTTCMVDKSTSTEGLGYQSNQVEIEEQKTDTTRPLLQEKSPNGGKSGKKVGKGKRGAGNKTRTCKNLGKRKAATKASGISTTETEELITNSDEKVSEDIPESQPLATQEVCLPISEARIDSGAQVMAKWSKDGHFYPANIVSVENYYQCLVAFEDGNVQHMKLTDVIPHSHLGTGQQVKAMDSDGFYDTGTIEKQYKKPNEFGYIIKLESGELRSYARSKVRFCTCL